jgi:hypothetical protein
VGSVGWEVLAQFEGVGLSWFGYFSSTCGVVAQLAGIF